MGLPTLRCDDWEALLADALDGQLTARDRSAFDAHTASCAGCADLLEHTKRGQEWLGYLHPEPEIPADLVNRILNKTAGAGAIPVPLIADAAQGTGAAVAAIPWRRSFQETRLLMTVAMAFFSIALTLNMAGVKLTSLRLADLRPATIGNSLSRQFYQKWGQISKFYNNARVVYQLESKMRELRRDSETPQPAPKKVEPSSRNEEQQGSEVTAQGSDASEGQWQRSAVGANRTIENRQPQAVNAGMELRRTETREEQRTEVKELNLRDIDKAGPRRMAATAGCDGRSLA
jgi:hypothetical protein